MFKNSILKMSVVNVKVQYIKPLGFQNLKEWMEEPNNVYIGRAGIVFIKNEEGVQERFPKVSSVFANPFKIDKKLDKSKARNEVIQKYKIYITERLEKEPELVKQLKSLKGKNLGCWCHPEPCHGDVLLELIDK